MHWCWGDFQIPRTDVGLARRCLVGGMNDFQEGAPSMEPARDTAKYRGGEPVIVRNVLSGSGVVGINIWGGELGLFVGNVPESVGIARGILQTYDGAEGKAAEVRDLEKRGSGKCAQ